jgi:hypothetical protein
MNRAATLTLFSLTRVQRERGRRLATRLLASSVPEALPDTQDNERQPNGRENLRQLTSAHLVLPLLDAN